MDIKLHFIQKGQGEPLILLHGNGEDGQYFVHQMEGFSKYYRVIALDTRGHGQSPKGSAPFTIAQFAKDLLDFLDEQGIDKADILGFSDGGNIALTFALTHPNRVKRLILNGANLNPSGIKRSVQLPVELGYRIAKMFAKHSPEAIHHTEQLGLMVNEPNISPEQLQNIPVRTLVIAGTRDMIRNQHTRLIYESLPNGELVLIEGDHFIANRQPEAFNRAVLDFLVKE